MIYVLIALASAVISGAVAIALTYFYLHSRAETRIGRAELEAQRIIEEAEAQAREQVLQAKDEGIQVRTEMDREVSRRRKDLDRVERRIEQKEEQLDRKTEQVERRDRNLQRKEKELDDRRTELDGFKTRQLEELQRVAVLTVDQAREILVSRVETEMRDILDRRVHELEQEAKAEANHKKEPPCAR